jgi:CheY-like chemotaxis protein
VTPTPKAKILISDTNATIVRQLKHSLTRAGHEVETVGGMTNTFHALELAAKNGQPFNLLIMQGRLPGGSYPNEILHYFQDLRKKGLKILGFSFNPEYFDGTDLPAADKGDYAIELSDELRDNLGAPKFLALIDRVLTGQEPSYAEASTKQQKK